MSKVIGYCRVSTVKQLDGNGLEAQRQAILAKYPDAEIVDEQYSGAKERPLFDAVMGRLAKGDTLVVMKLDRLCRTTKEGLEYIDSLRGKGVSVDIMNMGVIDGTPTGRLLLTMMLAFAEFERTLILDRMQSGREVARQRPGYHDGRPFEHEDVRPVRLDGESVADACRRLGVSRSWWYRQSRA